MLKTLKYINKHIFYSITGASNTYDISPSIPKYYFEDISELQALTLAYYLKKLNNTIAKGIAMNLIINGESKEVKAETKELRLENILKEMNFHPQLVVVELNGTIINSKNLKDQLIQDGDLLEIVTIVGGGS